MFSGERVPICPSFKMVCETNVVGVEVLDDYRLLALVTVPPFVAKFVIEDGVTFSCCMGFAGASWTDVPVTAYIFEIWRGCHVVLSDAFERVVMLN